MTFVRTSMAATLVVCGALSGCATPPPPSLYQWQNYQSNIDAYFRQDKLSPEAQTQLVEEDLKKIKTTGGKIPPGYHAHLGLLYAQQGKLDQFAEQIQQEKTLYPESAVFMDFLVRNFKK